MTREPEEVLGSVQYGKLRFEVLRDSTGFYTRQCEPEAMCMGPHTEFMALQLLAEIARLVKS